MFENRLKKYLAQCGLDVEKFLALVRENNGTVAGSIHIQIMLGEDVFKATDVDVFVESSDAGFTTLHRYLFENSTGLPSLIGPATPTDRAHARQTVQNMWNTSDFPVQDQLVQCFYTNGEQRLGIIKKFNIIHVYSYQMNSGMNIQVIQVRKHDDSLQIEDYVVNEFDMMCCTSTYDGSKYNLRHVNDVYRRALVLNTDFDKRVQYYTPTKTKNHQSRLAKYATRGFFPHDMNLKRLSNFNLQYGVKYDLCNRMNKADIEKHDKEAEEPVKVRKLLFENIITDIDDIMVHVNTKTMEPVRNMRKKAHHDAADDVVEEIIHKRRKVLNEIK